MENLIAGIACVFTTSIHVWFGWKKYRQEDFTMCLIILLIIGFLLRLYAGTDFYLHEWDERYHALVAKNLITSPFKPVLYSYPILPYDYRDWSANHVWLHKQPFPLWCMALSMKIFGVNEIALRLPSIGLSTLSVLGTFLIGKHLFSVKTGILAAFLHAVHGLSIELTGGRTATDHVDVFFQGLIVFAVVFALYHAKTKNTGWLMLMSLCCGLAILTKWLPALIVLLLWAVLCWQYNTLTLREGVLYGALALLMIGAVVLPWQIWIHTRFPKEATWEQQLNLKHFFESIEGHGRPVYYYLNEIRIVYGEMIYLPLAWLIYIWAKKMRSAYWFLGVWIFVPLLFFSAATTKMPAYLQISAPAFFLLTAFSVRYGLAIRKKTRYPLLVIVLVAGLVVLPVRYLFEPTKFFSTKERSPEWAEKLKELNRSLEPGKRYVLFGEERPIEAMFYCEELVAYPNTPNSAEIEDLESLGYTVILKDDKKSF
jgi:4-amino-4-deoxy-L-arabinose transferase-like glycosyltransferase